MSDLVRNNFPCVLVVDDEEDVRESLKLYLEDYIMELVFAKNLTEAKEYLTDGMYNALILDINLNGENGGELFKFLAEEETPNRNIDILVMSGLLTDSFLERNEGKAAFLEKPFSELKLMTALESFIDDVPASKPAETEEKNNPGPDAPLSPEMKKILGK